jgi:hypothetical protein
MRKNTDIIVLVLGTLLRHTLLWLVFFGTLLISFVGIQSYMSTKLSEVYYGGTPYAQVGSTVYDASISGANATETVAIHAALAKINYPLDYSMLKIVIVDALPQQVQLAVGNGTYVGEFLQENSTIYIKRDLLQQSMLGPGTILASSLSHEIGHQLDFFYLDDSDRAKITKILGFGSSPWQDPSKPWTAQPSEAFAEVFAFYSTGHNSGRIFTDDKSNEAVAGPVMDIVSQRAIPGTPVDKVALQKTQDILVFRARFEKMISVISQWQVLLIVGIVILLNIFWRTYRDLRKLALG